jgi:hypothetical protein
MGVWACESSKLCRDHVGAGIIGVDLLERGVVVVVVDKDLVAAEEEDWWHRRYRSWDSIDIDSTLCENAVGNVRSAKR